MHAPLTLPGCEHQEKHEEKHQAWSLHVWRGVAPQAVHTRRCVVSSRVVLCLWADAAFIQLFKTAAGEEEEEEEFPRCRFHTQSQQQALSWMRAADWGLKVRWDCRLLRRETHTGHFKLDFSLSHSKVLLFPDMLL